MIFAIQSINLRQLSCVALGFSRYPDFPLSSTEDFTMLKDVTDVPKYLITDSTYLSRY